MNVECGTPVPPFHQWDAIMLRKSPAPPPHTKTLDEQKTDFTAEGSPPPGKVGSTTPLADAPATTVAIPDATKRRNGDDTLTRKSIERSRKARTSPEPAITVETAVATSSEPGAVPSVPMQQAHQDVKRGLTDTDRGAEAGRTYRKLKN